MSKKNELRTAVLSKLSSSTIYAITNGLVKFITSTGVSNIIFYQNFVGILILIVFIKYKSISLNTRKIHIHLLRAIFYTIGTILWFYSITKLPISTATTLSITSPIFSIIGSSIFLKEGINFKRWLIVITGLIGSALLVKDKILGVFYIDMYLIFPILANSCYAACNILCRKMKEEKPIVMTFYMLLFALPIIGIFFGIEWHFVYLYPQILCLFIISILAVSAYTLTSKAYSLKSIVILIPFGFIKPILGYAIGIIFFHDKITILQTFATIIISLSVGIAHFYEKKHNIA